MGYAEELLSTRTGGFIAGFCVAVGFVTTILSAAFYLEYKKRYLLYFAVVSGIIHIAMILANKNPRDLAELRGDPVYFRAFHLMITVAIYYFYNLTVENLNNYGTRSFYILRATAFLAVFSRLFVILIGSPDIFPVAAFFTVIFMAASITVVIRWKPPTLTHRLCQLSSLGMSSLVLYPLIRSGILPKTNFEGTFLFIIIFLVTSSSILWLFGLVQLAREAKESIRLAENKTREKAFHDLRDFMNTPLQVLLAAIELSEKGKETELSSKMKKAVIRLSNINIFLGRYAKESDWTKRDRFFNEKDLEDPPKK
jgi:hypothetical protein